MDHRNAETEFPPPALAEDRDLLAILSSSPDTLRFFVHLLRYPFCMPPETAATPLANVEGTSSASLLDGLPLDPPPSSSDTVRGRLYPPVLQTRLI